MNLSEVKSQVVKNSFWGIISSILNRIGSFILAILLSKLLLPDLFGVYSLAMAVAFFFISFSDLGINQALIRYVSADIDKINGESSSYAHYLLKIKLSVTIIISLALLVLSYPLSFFIFRNQSLFPLFIILGFYVFFISLSSFFEALFFIRKNVNYISVKEFFLFFFKLSAILLVNFFVPSEFRLQGIFLSFVAVSILSLLFVVHFSKKVCSAVFTKAKQKINKKEILKFVLLLNVQNVSLMVLSQAGLVFLGIFLAEKYVGYYNVSWALVAGLISLVFSFSSIFIPVFTAISEEKFKLVLKKVFNFLLILALPVSFGLSLLSHFFISSIFGENYLTAVIPLRIISFLIPLIIGVDLSLAAFISRKKQKKFAAALFSSALIFILLSVFFIHLFSSSGENALSALAIISVAVWSLCFLSAIFLIKKEFNFNILSFNLIKSLVACGVMSAFISFALKFVGELNILFGIGIILLSMVVYFSVMFLIRGISKNDFLLFKKIFNKS